MKTTRPVTFDYFLSKVIEKDSGKRNTNHMNLNKLFNDVEANDLKITHLDNEKYGKVRIHSIKFDKKRDVWLLQILKLRERNLPGIVNEKADTYTPINLKIEEYVGEFISVIYDPARCLFYISRNRYSVAPTKLGDYLTDLYEKVYTIRKQIYLEPCQTPLDYAKSLKGVVIKRVETSIIRKGTNAENISGFLPKAIQSLGSYYDCGNLKINMSKGRGRGGFDNDEIISSLDNLFDSNMNLKALRVEFKTTEDTDVETLDLIKHRLQDVVEIEDSKTDPITHERMLKYMFIYYNEKKKIFELIN